MEVVRKCVCVYLLIVVCVFAEPSRRKLLTYLNPGGPKTPPGGDLLYVRSEGNDDTLHFLFSSQGAPTLLLIHCNYTSSHIQVNWTQYLDSNSTGGLWAEPQSSVTSQQALVFSRLLEYDDVNDTANASSGFFPPYDLQAVSWDRLHLSGPSPNVLLCGRLAEGSLCLQLMVFDSEGRGLVWPRLLHSDSSTQLEVWLDNIAPRSPRSRFLLELQAVGGATTLSQLDDIRFINDEFTPSIFKVTQWVSNSSDAFVQWKPVSYRSRSPSLGHASVCRHSSPQLVSVSSSLLIIAVFPSPVPVGLNVSFGLTGEPFYNSSRFLSWTLLMGVGVPLVDSFSPMIISIMAVAVGAPLVLLVVGGVFILSRSMGRAVGSYKPIN